MVASDNLSKSSVILGRGKASSSSFFSPSSSSSSFATAASAVYPPPLPRLSGETNIGGSGSAQNATPTSSGSLIPSRSRILQKDPNSTVQAPERVGGSQVRKRSRLGEDGSSTTQGRVPPPCKLGECLQQLNVLVDALSKGQRGNTAVVRVQLSECAKSLAIEASVLMTRVINVQELQLQYLKLEKEWKGKVQNLQDERSALQQQLIESQSHTLQGDGGMNGARLAQTYAQVVSKEGGSKVATGQQYPVPKIPDSMKYAPAECILIFKAEEKGSLPTKKEQEEFRRKVKEALGDDNIQAISAIRPTRHGGYTVIFQTEAERDQALEKFRRNERDRDITVEESIILAPKKKMAKMVCRDFSTDISTEEVMQDLYGNHNSHMKLVPFAQRQARLFPTRLGLVMEMSSQEAYAIQAQGGRVRFGFGREIRLEEYIPIQQCYKCSKFGHNANECKSEVEICRLCGGIGHAGKDCNFKENRERWKCANCVTLNMQKNMNVPTDHAAAQLHKCAAAQQQKAIKKMQLASAGIFVTTGGEDSLLKTIRSVSIKRTQGRTGAEENGKTGINQKKSNRSRSRNNNKMGASTSSQTNNRKLNDINREGHNMSSASLFKTTIFTSTSSSTLSSTSSSSSSSNIRRIQQQQNGRAIKVNRPRSKDGWQVVEQHGAECEERETPSRGRNIERRNGINSTSHLPQMFVETELSQIPDGEECLNIDE